MGVQVPPRPLCWMAVGPASTSFRHPPLAAVNSVSELRSLATLTLSAFADGRFQRRLARATTTQLTKAVVT